MSLILEWANRIFKNSSQLDRHEVQEISKPLGFSREDVFLSPIDAEILSLLKPTNQRLIHDLIEELNQPGSDAFQLKIRASSQLMGTLDSDFEKVIDPVLTLMKDWTDNKKTLLERYEKTLKAHMPVEYREDLKNLNLKGQQMMGRFINLLPQVSTCKECEAIYIDIFRGLAELGLPNESSRRLQELVLELCKNQVLLNTQFATDSLSSLIELEGMNTKERERDNIQAFKDLRSQGRLSEMDSVLRTYPDREWVLCSESGLGYMSCADWGLDTRESFFSTGKASRRIGLTRMGQVAFSEAELDFSGLSLTEDQITALFQIVCEYVNLEKESSKKDSLFKMDQIENLSEDQKEKARRRIEQFSSQLDSACHQVHAELKEKMLNLF